MEIKESLDSILQDRNEDSQVVKQLLFEIGVKGVVNFHAPIATLMRKLQKHAKKVNREAYRQSKAAIDVTFKKAMEQTDLKMKEHVNRYDKLCPSEFNVVPQLCPNCAPSDFSFVPQCT